ncbi:DUF6194 family protein, partial [Microbispora rosea]
MSIRPVTLPPLSNSIQARVTLTVATVSVLLAVVIGVGLCNGAPRAAWGDTFFYYDPDDEPANRKMPFATI